MQAHDSFGGCPSAASAVTAASEASSELSLALDIPVAFCPFAQKRAAAQIFLFGMNFFKRGNKPI